MSELGIYDYFNKEQFKHSPVIESDIARAADHIMGLTTPSHERYMKSVRKYMAEFQEQALKPFKKMPIISKWSVTSKLLLVVIPTMPLLVFFTVYAVQLLLCYIHNV